MDDRLCQICCVASGKYVCPRCNLLYCSVKCYQGEAHLECSEEFYKRSVFEYLNSEGKNAEDTRKMEEILHKFFIHNTEEGEEDTFDSDDETDIADRLKSTSLDDAEAVWERLTESEKQEFIDLIKNGCPQTLVPLWEPWWLYRRPDVLVEEVEEVSKSPVSSRMSCPTVENVPSFSDIAKRPPAPCIKWNIVNVIGSYAYVMRFFNGEPIEFLCEAADLLVSLSGNLRSSFNYDSYHTAVGEVSHEVLQRPWLDGSDSTLSRMKDDVTKITSGPDDMNCTFYLQAAISNFLRLLRKARCDVTSGKRRTKNSTFYKQFEAQNSIPSIPKEKFKLYEKKLQYYLSWIKSTSREAEWS